MAQLKGSRERVLAFSEISSGDRFKVGGKAENLGWLWNRGFRIPPGFVIAASLFNEFKKRIDLDRTIEEAQTAYELDDFDSADRCSLGLKKAVFDKENVANGILKREVTEAFHRISSEFAAVRSSATVEDSLEASFAGQFDSILNVTQSELIHSVIKCWASLYNTRALFYYRQNGIDLSVCSMAVIVQQMIDGELSGVILTQDHLKRGCILIEIVEGYGESLVSGARTPSSFFVDRLTLTITERTAPEGLGESFLKRLAEQALKIESGFGRPQDIEFTIKDQLVYILQSRPITQRKETE